MNNPTINDLQRIEREVYATSTIEQIGLLPFAEAVLREVFATPKTEALEGVRELPEVAICCGRTECGGECGNEWQGTQAAPKLLDDPRLQQLFGDAIEGALAFGFQGNNQPPEGHWLWRFWNIGRAEAAAPRSAAPGWMPIETAPKDGREFLACWTRQGNVMQVVKWNALHKFWQSKGESVVGFAANATHWKLIDPPPITPSEGGKHEGGVS